MILFKSQNELEEAFLSQVLEFLSIFKECKDSDVITESVYSFELEKRIKFFNSLSNSYKEILIK